MKLQITIPERKILEICLNELNMIEEDILEKKSCKELKKLIKKEIVSLNTRYSILSDYISNSEMIWYVYYGKDEEYKKKVIMKNIKRNSWLDTSDEELITTKDIARENIRLIAIKRINIKKLLESINYYVIKSNLA